MYGKWADKFTCWYSRGLRISMGVFSGLGYTVWENKLNNMWVIIWCGDDGVWGWSGKIMCGDHTIRCKYSARNIQAEYNDQVWDMIMCG